VTLFAFYGTFTSGQPGHGNLAGARLLERTRTAPRYRLFFVDGLWPGLIPTDDGVAIECELYDCSEELGRVPCGVVARRQPTNEYGMLPAVPSQPRGCGRRPRS